MQRLTPREREIALLVGEGLCNKQIARQLTVAEGTVKVHLHNVYDKLAIRNRTMLALLALQEKGAVLLSRVSGAGASDALHPAGLDYPKAA
jgi:DNA-binding NarL/FixJ family response regulator